MSSGTNGQSEQRFNILPHPAVRRSLSDKNTLIADISLLENQ